MRVLRVEVARRRRSSEEVRAARGPEAAQGRRAAREPQARWFAYWSVAENLFLASRGRRAALVLNAWSQIIVRRDATEPCREIGGR